MAGLDVAPVDLRAEPWVPAALRASATDLQAEAARSAGFYLPPTDGGTEAETRWCSVKSWKSHVMTAAFSIERCPVPPNPTCVPSSACCLPLGWACCPGCRVQPLDSSTAPSSSLSPPPPTHSSWVSSTPARPGWNLRLGQDWGLQTSSRHTQQNLPCARPRAGSRATERALLSPPGALFAKAGGCEGHLPPA